MDAIIGNVASIDLPAAEMIKRLRTDRGLSPEALSQAMHMAGLGYVSGKTIRRVEVGFVPRVRVQFALASFFDLVPSQVWVPRRITHRVAA